MFSVPLMFKSSCGAKMDTVQQSPLGIPSTQFLISPGNINVIYTPVHGHCRKNLDLQQTIAQTFTYLQATCRFRIMA